MIESANDLSSDKMLEKTDEEMHRHEVGDHPRYKRLIGPHRSEHKAIYRSSVRLDSEAKTSKCLYVIRWVCRELRSCMMKAQVGCEDENE